MIRRMMGLVLVAVATCSDVQLTPEEEAAYQSACAQNAITC